MICHVCFFDGGGVFQLYSQAYLIYSGATLLELFFRVLLIMSSASFELIMNSNILRDIIHLHLSNISNFIAGD